MCSGPNTAVFNLSVLQNSKLIGKHEKKQRKALYFEIQARS